MCAKSHVFRRMPWDVVLLLGGGFALSAAFKTSGLSDTLGNSMTSFRFTICF